MPKTAYRLALALVLAFLVATNPIVADAAKKISGHQIKNNSIAGKELKKNAVTGNKVKKNTLTGADIKEASLKKVPKAKVADGLSVAPPGSTQSGAFRLSGGDSVGGYATSAITYPRPLSTPIADDNIIDTAHDPDPANCPGPGQAAPGYLCLYSRAHPGLNTAYGYSEVSPYSETGLSYGVGLYAAINLSIPITYMDGIWTVGAPLN